MLPALPEPSRKRLEPAPLQLVVCQIRHEPRTFQDQRPWFGIADQLRAEYPIIEPHVVHDLAVNVGPAGVQTSGEPQQGFQLKSKDGAWNVALLPQFFALECTGYTRWTEYRERLQKVIAAVISVAPPQIEQRLGLRFIDRLSPDGAVRPSGWVERLSPAIAGELRDEVLGPRLVGSQHAFQLREEPYDAVVRHGVQPEGANVAYVIDTDCARQGGRLFDSEQIHDDVERLHTLALQIFQACLAPKYLSSLECDDEGES